MPRTARRPSESNIYHIMLRGIDRKQIFYDREDNEKFIETLEKYKGVSGYEIYAYCLMGNHIHMLIKTGNEPLDTSLRRIGASFVYWYNIKYARSGHLFQDRFKSEAIDSNAYFLTAFRYILRNPVAAGMCVLPEEYPYSSAAEYLKDKKGITDKNFAVSVISGEKMAEFLHMDTDEKCLDIVSAPPIGVTDSVAAEMIKKEFGTLTPNAGKKKEREAFSQSVRTLCGKGIGHRQLSRLTGISRRIIDGCFE